jgi:hypothetical protein
MGDVMPNSEHIKILHIQKVDEDAVLVDFGDDTVAIFTSEQLIALAPRRIQSELDIPEDWGGEWVDIYSPRSDRLVSKTRV